MSGKIEIFSRRDFIKTAGAASIGAALIPFSSATPAHAGSSTKTPDQMAVPTRPFGKTGVNVSMLALGGELKSSDILIFRQTLKMGVTYWDTANSYGCGSFVTT